MISFDQFKRNNIHDKLSHLHCFALYLYCKLWTYHTRIKNKYIIKFKKNTFVLLFKIYQIRINSVCKGQHNITHIIPEKIAGKRKKLFLPWPFPVPVECFHLPRPTSTFNPFNPYGAYIQKSLFLNRSFYFHVFLQTVLM